MVGLLWPILGSLGPCVGALGSMLGRVGPILGPGWAYVGLCWVYVGPMLAYVGPMLALSWPYVGPMLAYVGPVLPFLGPMLGLCWRYPRPRPSRLKDLQDAKFFRPGQLRGTKNHVKTTVFYFRRQKKWDRPRPRNTVNNGVLVTAHTKLQGRWLFGGRSAAASASVYPGAGPEASPCPCRRPSVVTEGHRQQQ